MRAFLWIVILIVFIFSLVGASNVMEDKTRRWISLGDDLSYYSEMILQNFKGTRQCWIKNDSMIMLIEIRDDYKYRILETKENGQRKIVAGELQNIEPESDFENLVAALFK